MRTSLTCSVLALLLTTTARAFAEPATPQERALAKMLAEDAAKLLAAGKIADACDKLATSNKFDPLAATMLDLAKCHERQGKTTTALGDFKEALKAATRDGNQARQAEARDHAAALERRVSQLTVTLAPGPAIADFELRLDQTLVATSAVTGTPLPIDPGTHLLAASAPGRKSWQLEVIAKEGATQAVQVPALEMSPLAAPLADPRAPLDATSTPEKLEPWRVPVGATLVAVGAVGLLAGTILGVVAVHESSTHSSAPKAVGAAVTGLAGAALTVVGIVVLIVPPKAKTAPSVSAFVGPGSTGLHVSF